MLDWDNWSVQERCVGELIIERFEEKDPTGNIGIHPVNIYEHYYYRLKEMWIPRQSSSVSRKKSVYQIFTRFRNRCELIQPNGENTVYYLTENGYLYQELQRRVANNST